MFRVVFRHLSNFPRKSLLATYMSVLAVVYGRRPGMLPILIQYSLLVLGLINQADASMLKGAQDHVPEKLDPTDQRGTPSFTELNNEGKYTCQLQLHLSGCR